MQQWTIQSSTNPTRPCCSAMPRRPVTHCRRKFENPTRSKLLPSSSRGTCGNRRRKYQCRQPMHMCGKRSSCPERKTRGKQSKCREVFQEHILKRIEKILRVFLCISFWCYKSKAFYKRRKEQPHFQCNPFGFFKIPAQQPVMF